MYRNLHSLTICLTIYWCRAAVVPVKDQSKNEQTVQSEETNERAFATLGIGAQQPIYPIAQSNQPVVNRYLYPTYPEYGNNGYAIQTGYESYLVPAVLPQQNTDSPWISEIGTSLLPFSDEILLYGVRAGVYLLHFLFAIILGGAFTTMICTFTPICTISFIGFGFTNHQVKKQVAELSQSYLTDEIINAATTLISKALDNYAAMQQERYENTKQKEGEKQDNSSNKR